MLPIPEWAPNAHPLVVHFPIALFFVAVLADVFALIFRQHTFLRWSVTGLYVLGILSAIVTFYTGREAAESVFLSAKANAVLTDHADWAEWTLWFYGFYTLIRLAADRFGYSAKFVLHLALAILGGLGLGLVVETGEHGAQMVYQYGVGVAQQAVQPSGQTPSSGQGHDPAQHNETPRAHDHSKHSHTAQTPDETAQIPITWPWNIGHDGVFELKKRFKLKNKNWDTLRPEVVHEDTAGDVLVFHSTGKQSMMVTSNAVQSLQYDLRFNRDAFKGTIRLIHHVQDDKNYDFLEIKDVHMKLGRVTQNDVKIHDQASISASGWMDVRSVSDGTHFRGYLGRKMVVHGHGSEPPAGAVGLFIEGVGTLKIATINIQSLR